MSASISFDRAANYYDATRGFSPEHEQQAIGAIATTLGEIKGPVLEIGIGTGRIAIPLQQRGYDYYGVDLSQAMMQKLRENAAARSKYVFPLVQGDITQLPFRDVSFAAVVAVHVFHLVSSWQAALQEARRVLRSGGIIIHAGSSMGGERQHPIYAKWRELLQAEGYDQWRQSSADIGPTIEATLGEMGATTNTQTAFSWSFSRTPREIYDRLASRQWSASWLVPDDIFARAITHLGNWVAQEYTNLDQPEQEPHSFFVTAARF